MANYRHYLTVISGALVLASALVVPNLRTLRGSAADNERESSSRAKTDRFLLVWAGDQARKKPDFLAVLNFDETSPHYGQLLSTTPLDGAGASGNEPHHVGLSADGTILATGGLLSVLRGQKEIFFFDVSRPAAPKFLSAADPPMSAITDEFHSLPEGGFLVTMMGGATGHAPGRVAEFNRNLELVAEYPRDPPQDGFNPHGISVRADLNLMITSDFICPATTLHAVPGNPDMRGSVRIWDFQRRAIVRTVRLPSPAGTIDVKLLPNGDSGLAYTAGMTDDTLYLIDTRHGTAHPVFNFGSIAKGGWPQLMRITKDGARLFVSMNTAGKVVMFDISTPRRPKVLKVLDLGADSGPHYIALTPDEKRLVITDYFLNEDDFGKVHAEGDHRIHVARVTRNNLVLDERFSVDFNGLISTGPARPHGVAFK